MRIGLIAPEAEFDRDIFLREKLAELVANLKRQGLHVNRVEFKVGNSAYSVYSSQGNIAEMTLEQLGKAE